MIFFGHSNFYDNDFIKVKILDELNKTSNNINIDFYPCGAYSALILSKNLKK